MEQTQYIACPQCGTGLARNWLKCREPEWVRCDECVKIWAEKKDRPITTPNQETKR
jgi:uncharacterized Zn finger protein